VELSETIEAYLLQVHGQRSIRRLLADPWQAMGSIQRLQAAGVPIEEFPQTVANTTRMGQTLYEALRGKSLVLFADAILRQQAMNTTAVETPRGFRIAKDLARKKIDAIVALSMACVGALETTGPPPMSYAQFSTMINANAGLQKSWDDRWDRF
jgi:phage terminase large subunit-like protein